MRQFHSWMRAVLLGAALLPALAQGADDKPAQAANPAIVQ